MRPDPRAFAFVVSIAAAIFAHAQTPSQPATGDVVTITVENFIRAESDLWLSVVALKEGGFGKFEHHHGRREVGAKA